MHIYVASSHVPFSHVITNMKQNSLVPVPFVEFQSQITNLVMEKRPANHNKLFREILIHVKSGSVLSLAIKL